MPLDKPKHDHQWSIVWALSSLNKLTKNKHKQFEVIALYSLAVGP